MTESSVDGGRIGSSAYVLKHSGDRFGSRFSTEPPTVVVGRSVASADGVSAAFRRSGRRIQLVDSGVPVAVATPVKDHRRQYTIDHAGQQWLLQMEGGSWWRRATVEGETGLLVQADYRREVGGWYGGGFLSNIQRDHSGSISGKVEIDAGLPPVVAALALRLTFGSWLYVSPRTGQWTKADSRGY